MFSALSICSDRSWHPKSISNHDFEWKIPKILNFPYFWPAHSLFLMESISAPGPNGPAATGLAPIGPSPYRPRPLWSSIRIKPHGWLPDLGHQELSKYVDLVISCGLSFSRHNKIAWRPASSTNTCSWYDCSCVLLRANITSTGAVDREFEI